MRRYKEALDALRFTEEEQAMLTKKLEQAAAAAQPPRKRRHPRRVICTALIAAILVITAAAGYAGYLADPEAARTQLAKFFHLSPENAEEYSGFTANGAYDVCNGVIVSLDGIYTDDHTVCAIFSVTKEDGTAFVDLAAYPDTYALTFEDIRYLAGGEPVSGGGSGHTTDADMKTFYFNIEISLPNVQQAEGIPLTFTFSNILRYKQAGNYIGPDQVIVPGVWTIEVPLTPTDTAVNAQAGQQFAYGNLNVTIDRIAFTPTFYHIEFSYDKQMTYDDDFNLYLDGVRDEYGYDYYRRGASPILNTKDGAHYQLEYQYSLHGHAATGMLPAVIPLEEMESITLFGQTIPLVWPD